MLRWAGTLSPWLWRCLFEAGFFSPLGSPGASIEGREQSSRPLRGQPTLPTPTPGAALKPWRARGTQAWLRSSVGTSCPSLLWDSVSRVQRLRAPSPSPVSPSLPHYLPLSASCLFRRARRRCLSPGGSAAPGPETPARPSSRHRALGSPSSLAASGCPCHRPSPGPALPRFLALRARRLRAGTGWGRRWSPPDAAGALGRAVARARGGLAPGRMGCTVSLVCCEALEPGPPCGPQPPGSPPAPAPWEYREPRGSTRAQSRRLLLQVGRCAGRWQAQPGSPETGKEPRGESTQHGSGRAGAWIR